MNNVNIINYKDNIDFIKIKACDIEYTLCNFGASMYSLHFNNDPLILELESKDEFLTSPQFFNKTLGVVAGRIPSLIKLNDKEYHLKEDGDNNFSLHGGKETSISFKNFKYKIKEFKSKIDVIFTYSPRKGENGFPGKINIKIIYSLFKESNKFKIKLLSNVKEDSLINLSNHIYWNINKSKTINDYKLKFDAPRILKIDSNLLPIDKELTPNYLLFKRSKALKSSLDIASKKEIGTIDNTFIFNELNKKHKVTLKNEEYEIIMSTNYDAMNIYCDSSLTRVKFKNNPELKERKAIALEPQKSVIPLSNLIYKKNDKYNYFIEYKIKRRNYND